MDTATSALAPFKPELIEELVVVTDDEPLNPLVVMNKGHLLGQLTVFIGPVNFYCTVRGTLPPQILVLSTHVHGRVNYSTDANFPRCTPVQSHEHRRQLPHLALRAPLLHLARSDEVRRHRRLYIQVP